ncbi:MAG: S-layer homology domain-containing protein [Pseudoflavonifractor sp.]
MKQRRLCTLLLAAFSILILAGAAVPETAPAPTGTPAPAGTAAPTDTPVPETVPPVSNDLLVPTKSPAGFSDVGERDWFKPWTDLAYGAGLMEGPGDGRFYPYRPLTAGEALKLAAVLDSGGAYENIPVPGKPWYTGALGYCLEQGLITKATFDSYDRAITRGEMALVFAATAPVREGADLNDLKRIRISIPDVLPTDFASEAIYSLYAKGVLTGSDKQLTFRPNDVITRSEVAAIVTRLALPDQRITLWSA